MLGSILTSLWLLRAHVKFKIKMDPSVRWDDGFKDI